MKKKRIAAVFAVIAFSIAGLMLCNFLYGKQAFWYTGSVMQEFYDQDEIDVLILGASHPERGINSSIVSEQTGKKVFSAASDSQKIYDSLELLRQAVKRYELQQVCFDMSYTNSMSTAKYQDRTNPVSTYSLADNMERLSEKVKYILKVTPPPSYINAFFPAHRYNDRLFDMNHIAEVYDQRRHLASMNKSGELESHNNGYYAGKGFVAVNQYFPEYAAIQKNNISSFNENRICDDWKTDLFEMIRICQENDIELILFSTPISNPRLMLSGNFDEYRAFVQELLKDTGLTYTDFNLLTNEAFPYDHGNYYDGHHMNKYGAEKFSYLFAEFLNGDLPQSAFASSVQKRLEDEPPAFYGFAHEETGDSMRLRLLFNHPEAFEYEFSRDSSCHEKEILDDPDGDGIYCVPREDEYSYYVTYWPVGCPEQSEKAGPMVPEFD